MIDISASHLLITLLTGWRDRQERDVLRYLLEENRVLRRQLRGRRLQLSDDDRRRLAVRAYRLGRGLLREIATVVTPDTLLRWHRQLVARKWTYARRRASRRGVLTEIRRLTVRMAEENPTWGYTRIQGALKNVGHRVGRSTIARILKVAGLPLQPERPTSWQTFVRAHWGVIAGADFLATEVWTWCGLVTYYSVFVIDLASRRVHIVGSTPHPDGLFMRQVSRTLTATDGLLSADRVLICDRDHEWSGDVRQMLEEAGVQVDRRDRAQSTSGADPSPFTTRWTSELLRAGRVMWASVDVNRLGGVMGHYALDRLAQPSGHQVPDGHRFIATPILGGLHHEYHLQPIAA